MVTNNEAVDNFLNGKRNLAAYQFSQLMKETTTTTTKTTTQVASNSNHQQHLSPSSSSASPLATTATSLSYNTDIIDHTTNNATSINTANINSLSNDNDNDKQQQSVNCDEVAFNYAMVNLFTGCPERASIIFSDLVRRYPRNPRLWLRLAESLLAAERSKMSDYEYMQQLTHPNSRDHLIKTKNRPILIKINPNYCQQQKLQHASNKAPPETPTNFLANIRGFLLNSLDLIAEYNDISLLTDDIPTGTDHTQQKTQVAPTMQDLFGGISSPAAPTTIPAAPIDYFSDSLTATSKIDSQIQQQQQQLLLQQQQQQKEAKDSSKSLDTKLSRQLSYANPYKSISRSALYHLRIKVQLNLAYICLCMGEPTKALAYTTQCLKSSLQGYEKVLASLYHAEACILTNQIDEAIQFLNLEVLNMAKNLSQDHPLKFGDTGRIVYSDEMQHQFDKDALATVVTYNLSVACAAKGEFINAQKILMRCIASTKHIPMQLIICLLYIQLQQGQVESAKKTILSNLPQFR